MRNRLSGVACSALAAGLALLCGCATVRHPSSYKQGRPEWTYDLVHVREADLPQGFLRDEYYLFAGAETTSAATEEAARAAALLNALEQVKLFLHSHGEMLLRRQVANDGREGWPLPRHRGESEVLRFEMLLDARADAHVAHLEAVRWYLEEHRPLWRMLLPFPNDTRASRWRAWCLVAVPKDICDVVIREAMSQYEKEATARPPEASGRPAEQHARDLPAAREEASKSYTERVSDGASLGVANVFSGPVEILNQPFLFAARQPADNELLQLAGFLQGIPVGVVKGSLRIVYGAGSLVLCPFGAPMLPIVSPVRPEFADPLLPM